MGLFRLLHPSIEEPVHISLSGQDLPARPDRCNGSVNSGSFLDKQLNLLLIFISRGRAGRVEEPTARCQQRPQPPEQRPLGLRSSSDVLGAT